MLTNLLFMVILTSIHLFVDKIFFLNILSRDKLLSLAGGISIAFVFVHILPELHSLQIALEENHEPAFYLNNYLYMMSLIGVLLFYGLEKWVVKHQVQKASNKEKAIYNSIYWLHIGIFATLNLVIGYYLHHQQEVNSSAILVAFIALGFHFLVNDYALLKYDTPRYLHSVRWIMAGAVVAGWGLGMIVVIPALISSVLFALLAGAIVLNSFKEELPEDKESNFGFFLIGSILYSLLLLL